MRDVYRYYYPTTTLREREREDPQPVRFDKQPKYPVVSSSIQRVQTLHARERGVRRERERERERDVSGSLAAKREDADWRLSHPSSPK